MIRRNNPPVTMYTAGDYHIDEIVPWTADIASLMAIPCDSTVCESSLFIIIDNFNKELQAITELCNVVKTYYSNNFDENDTVSFIQTKGNLIELNQIMSTGLTQGILTKKWKKINVMIVASIIPYGNYPLFHSTSQTNAIYLNDIIEEISKLFKNSPINSSALVHQFGNHTETSQKGLPQPLKSVTTIIHSPDRVMLEKIIQSWTNQIGHEKKISTLRELFHHGDL